MKSRILLAILIMIVLVSCDELLSLTIDTELTMDLPISVTESTALLKSGSTSSYTFSKSDTIYLNDDDDVADHIEKIKSVSVKDVDVSIFNLSEGEVIETLEVIIPGVGTLLTINNITESGVITPTIEQEVLENAGQKILDDLQLSATVNGTSNYAPMQFNVELAFILAVKAGIL